jgi:hypothetical protein
MVEGKRFAGQKVIFFAAEMPTASGLRRRLEAAGLRLEGGKKEGPRRRPWLK